jgi:hypothetical protein
MERRVKLHIMLILLPKDAAPGSYLMRWNSEGIWKWRIEKYFLLVNGVGQSISESS